MDFEIITVTKDIKQVSCLGYNDDLGHPLVYLKFKENEKELVCPYCSKKFKKKD